MNGFMIRADDLGFSEAVNYGIQKTVESGMIRNIGFMVNMASSIHGWKLVKGHKVYFWMDSMGQDYDPAKSFRRMIENAHEDGVDLMIFHPGYLDDYILTHSSLTVPRTRETAFLTSEDFSAYVKEKDISFLLYRDIV